MTPDKVQKAKLKPFLAKFNYYINKLLIAKSDPFIESRNRVYLQRLDFDKLDKIQGVFNRLLEDTETRH